MLDSSKTWLCGIFLLIAAVTPNFADAMSVSLSPSIPFQAPVGALVTWTATVPDAGSGTLWYRFRARSIGSDFQMVRDYGPDNSLEWTASEHEGLYEIEASVRNVDTGNSATTSAAYRITTRVGDGVPVISPTANPLVFLYSAPPCAVGGQMRVQFQPVEGQAGITRTPFKVCQEGLSMNFYLAGLKPNSTYLVRHAFEFAAPFGDGPILTVTTPSVTVPLPSHKVLQPMLFRSTDGILLQSPLVHGMVANDLDGNLVWFYPGVVSFLTRPRPGGFFFGIVEDPPSDPVHQLLREFDLAGTTLRETNAARVNEQLAAMGKSSIGAFHHDVEGLPDGGILTLGSTEQILTDVQGPGPVDVIGDMILVLDANLQVVWAWDAFDHLDPRRMATLGEKCIGAGAGCPPFHLASQANDWLHSNSLQYTPDGNILLSMRHQDMLIKVDYRNGAGTGDIIWKLGQGGDFQIDSNTPSPWFSHQHDARFEFGDNTTLTLFDNGNVRYAKDQRANSRGQVYRLDEANRIARLVLSADLGGYSFALGSSQRLPNGDYHFTLGLLPDATSKSVEIDGAGNVVYAIQALEPEYRSFRMGDLYQAYETERVYVHRTFGHGGKITD